MPEPSTSSCLKIAVAGVSEPLLPAPPPALAWVPPLDGLGLLLGLLLPPELAPPDAGFPVTLGGGAGDGVEASADVVLVPFASGLVPPLDGLGLLLGLLLPPELAPPGAGVPVTLGGGAGDGVEARADVVLVPFAPLADVVLVPFAPLVPPLDGL